MRFPAALGGFLLLPILSVAAFQWPSDPGRIERSFLESDGSVPSKGILFKGAEGVRPFDSGEVIFRSLPDPFSPLRDEAASILVLEHENGFQSVYKGLEEEAVRALPNRVDRETFIGVPSLGEGAYRFFIRDARLKRLVNPLLLLPGLHDKIPPVLEAFRLVGSDGQVYAVTPDAALPADNYEVYLLVRDEFSREKGLFSVPFSVSLYNLGSLLVERKLDTLVRSGHGLSLQDGSFMETLYDREGFLYLGGILLNSGTAALEVAMEDFFGNERTVRFDLSVSR